MGKILDLRLSMLDDFHAPIWRSDAQGHCDYFNRTWLAFTGRSLEQELGDGWLEGVHPEDRERCMGTYLRAVAARRPFDMEYRLRRHDGEYRTVLDAGRPLIDEQGNFAGFLGSAYDIGDGRAAQTALRDSEARYRQLADFMPQLIWKCDPDINLTYVNQRVLDYCGVQPDDLAARGWDWLVHPEDVPIAWERWYRAQKNPGEFEFELRIRRADGTYRWNLVRSTPERRADGSVIQWFGTCTDIEDRKRIEQALAESSRQKDQFLAMLGHELRNPLAPIRNATHLLHQVTGSDPRLQRVWAMIDRQVTHLTRLVDDLLDVSRITRGKMNLHTETLDLVELVRMVVDDYGGLLAHHDLKLTVRLPAHPLWVAADSVRLAQAVGNLLHNACKFTNPGGHITVEVEAAGPDARVTVADTGIGIAPELRESIFEPFAQADVGRGGLGLGLALVRGLVELQGGTVDVDAGGPEGGSVFTIRLAQSAAPTATLPAAPLPVRSTRSRQILVVEDNLDAAESTRLVLEAVGHKVAEAHTGSVALETARAFHPEIVLCDIGLPGGMDGYAVARALREDTTFGAPYLIALTGFGQEQDRRRACEAGFDLHLTKPIEAAALERLIAALPPRA
jgi:PAS domain S-box-containing protein